MKSPPAGCGQATLDKRELVMRCKGRPIPDTTWGWVCDLCGLTLPQKPAPRPVPVPVAPGQTCLPGLLPELAPEPVPPLAPIAPAPLPPLGQLSLLAASAERPEPAPPLIPPPRLRNPHVHQDR